MGVDDRQGRGVNEGGSSRAQMRSEHESHHHGHGVHHEKPMSSEDAIRSLLLLGQVALDAGDYESAVEAFASALQIESNEVALYNLGSMYARGLGIRRDFVEGARLFRKAELLGNGHAGKLCRKCMFDCIRDGFDAKSPADLYATMAVFVSRVYPEATDQRLEVNHGLLAVAATYLNEGHVTEAAKVYRAAADFGNDEIAQRYLASL